MDIEKLAIIAGVGYLGYLLVTSQQSSGGDLIAPNSPGAGGFTNVAKGTDTSTHDNSSGGGGTSSLPPGQTAPTQTDYEKSHGFAANGASTVTTTQAGGIASVQRDAAGGYQTADGYYGPGSKTASGAVWAKGLGDPSRGQVKGVVLGATGGAAKVTATASTATAGQKAAAAASTSLANKRGGAAASWKAGGKNGH